MKNIIVLFYCLLFSVELFSTGKDVTDKQCMQGIWKLEYYPDLYEDGDSLDVPDETQYRLVRDTDMTVIYIDNAENIRVYSIECEFKGDDKESYISENDCFSCEDSTMYFTCDWASFKKTELPVSVLRYLCVYYPSTFEYFTKKRRKAMGKLGIIEGETLIYYTSEQFDPFYTLKYGDIVRILGEKDDFYKFEYESFGGTVKTGYLEKRSVKLVH